MLGKYSLITIGIVVLVLLGDALKVELLRDEYERLGTKVDFYAEEWQNGLSTHVETDGPCKNLPRRWHKRPVSLDTRGTCGKVCSEADCQGDCQIVIPGVGDQQLSTIKFSKKIVSVQGCFYGLKKETF